MSKFNMILGLLDYHKECAKPLSSSIDGGIRAQVVERCFSHAVRERDGSNLQFEGGKLVFGTWDTSYHNGDIENYRRLEADLPEDLADLILADLEAKYEEKEIDKLLKEKEANIREALRVRVRQAIGRFYK